MEFLKLLLLAGPAFASVITHTNSTSLIHPLTKDETTACSDYSNDYHCWSGLAFIHSDTLRIKGRAYCCCRRHCSSRCCLMRTALTPQL